jgi:hypothetical protein
MRFVLWRDLQRAGSTAGPTAHVGTALRGHRVVAAVARPPPTFSCNVKRPARGFSGSGGIGGDDPDGDPPGCEPVILVKVGRDIPSLLPQELRASVLGLDRLALLKALKRDEGFADSFKDKPLGKLHVKVRGIEYDEVPTADELKAADELTGAKTLGVVAAKICSVKAPNLFIHVDMTGTSAACTASGAW